MAIQIPGFCGIYFNQPLPLSVKSKKIFYKDEGEALREYNRIGHCCLDIEDGYVPKPFMAYDGYLVRFYPSSNDRQHLMDKEYYYRLKVGAVKGWYEGSMKNKYGDNEYNQKNKEMVISLFHKTKAFLDDWLEVEGKVKTQNHTYETALITNALCMYDLSNCLIFIGYDIYEDDEYIRSEGWIEVETKKFYNILGDIYSNKENGDVSAFM